LRQRSTFPQTDETKEDTKMNWTQTTGTTIATGARRSRTRRLTLAVSLVAALALFGAGCTKNGAALESYNRVNSARTSAGLRPVNIDDTLVNKAQAWADHLAATRSVSHSVLTSGVGDNWSVLGENVGWAHSVSEMQSMFMNSPAHRANILNGRFNRLGTGVAEVNGAYYVVQVFAG
jgi:uncharacterized protein YkwD